MPATLGLTVHEEMSRSNAEAPVNMSCMVFTRAVLKWLNCWLKFEAPWNIAHILRLLDYGFVTHDGNRQGSIWCDQNVCVWIDAGQLCLTLDEEMFNQCIQPDQAAHVRHAKWEKYWNQYPIQPFLRGWQTSGTSVQ